MSATQSAPVPVDQTQAFLITAVTAIFPGGASTPAPTITVATAVAAPTVTGYRFSSQGAPTTSIKPGLIIRTVTSPDWSLSPVISMPITWQLAPGMTVISPQFYLVKMSADGSGAPPFTLALQQAGTGGAPGRVIALSSPITVPAAKGYVLTLDTTVPAANPTAGISIKPI